MLKKALFVGLGITVFAVKKANAMLRAGGKMFTGRSHETVTSEEVSLDLAAANGRQPGAAAATVVPRTQPVQPTAKPDDLTTIKGIGPTYAKRLEEAGITSYSSLAMQSPDKLREITRATGSQADPVEWIAEARALASFFSLD